MTSSINSKTTWQQRFGDRWDSIRPVAIALVVGLVAGPLISNSMGWQVTQGRADRQSHASAVEQQAMICAAQARVVTPNSAALDWSARRELAEKFAVMPGRESAESDVISACTQILARDS
ncbi:hypothetical protein [Ferrovibrio sp.]|uniref:hypothetical protein n=1 Tax=Ferrovibrio sp. TaxID=1917215 RepID=UPI002632A7DE|nr:hypothetical protein [Ferrovibrio sp.]